MTSDKPDDRVTAAPLDLRWLAHRGGGNAAPENTLAAFRAGLAAGFRAFECDVKLSCDGVPYLLHDDTLTRTTDGHGPAAAWSWARLQRLDAGAWYGARYRGEPLPSLDQVLVFAATHGVWLNLEIKPCPGTEVATGRAVAMRAAHWTRQHPDLPPPLLSSFSLTALQAARAQLDAQAVALPLACLHERFTPSDLRAAQALHAEALHCDWRGLRAAEVQAVHAAGLALRVYTVNRAPTAARLLALGVEGLFTDSLQLPSRVRVERRRVLAPAVR